MSQRRSLWFALGFALGTSLVLTVATPKPASAQIFKKMKDAAKKKAEEAAKAALKDSSATAGAKESAASTASTSSSATATAPANAASASNATTATAAPAAGGRQTEWANYDFVPGSTVLFFTDFTEDKVGNFPKKLEFKTGAMEIVQLAIDGDTVAAVLHAVFEPTKDYVRNGLMFKVGTVTDIVSFVLTPAQ